MFVALIIHCIETTCVASVHPTIFRTEQDCYTNLANGIIFFREERKETVPHYQCVEIPTKM